MINTNIASFSSKSINPNDWPRITVVTPSYNQASYIEETIQSVLSQAYPNLEYIIIDGGSSDGSVEIIKKYEPELTYWCSELDKGQSNAINKGWKLGTGEIFAWLNSDDVYMPGSLERIGAIFRENQSLNLVYGDFNIIDETSDLKEVVKIGEKEFADLLSGCCFGQPSTFVSREAVVRTGYLNEELHLCMDYDLWLKITSRSRIQYLPEVLASFRIHGESKTTKQSVEMMSQQLDVVNDFVAVYSVENNIMVSRVARFNLNAGIGFLESGLRQEAKTYIKKGLDLVSLRPNEEEIRMIASSFVQTYRRSSLIEINKMFSEYSNLANIQRRIESWIYALLSWEGRWGRSRMLNDAFQALIRNPNAKTVLAIKSPVLKALIGHQLHSLIQSVVRRRKSATRSK